MTRVGGWGVCVYFLQTGQLGRGCRLAAERSSRYFTPSSRGNRNQTTARQVLASSNYWDSLAIGIWHLLMLVSKGLIWGRFAAFFLTCLEILSEIFEEARHWDKMLIS